MPEYQLVTLLLIVIVFLLLLLAYCFKSASELKDHCMRQRLENEALRLDTREAKLENEAFRQTNESLIAEQKNPKTIEAQQILHDLTRYGVSIVKITPISPDEVFWRSPK